MPLQKGKKRRRPRRHGPPRGDVTVEQQPAAKPAPKRSAPIMRRGWTPPLWVNVVIGLVLVAVGVVFWLVPQKGMGMEAHIIILLGYFALAGLYLGKAFRQYRSKRQP